MLQAAPSASQIPSSAMRRGHAHKRSAAISGDFDLDFFRGPSIHETLSSSSKPSSSLPTESYMKRVTAAPAVVVTAAPEEAVEQQTQRQIPSATNTPSPKKKHTRLNSWAHSFIRSKSREQPQKVEYNSSSNESTPENNRTLTTTTNNSNYSYAAPTSVPSTIPKEKYQIPEAIIDLDLASGGYYDPATHVPSKVSRSFHRRTESAPELEDFLKYKIFSTHSNKPSRRNSTVYEEEEDDDENEGVLSSTSSNAAHGLSKNPSVNSLNSASSAGASGSTRVQSPGFYQQSLTSTPTSTKTRRGGASAARYQSYYNNNILLANALKSSESLSQATGQSTTASLHKPSYGSMKSTTITPSTLPHSVSSSSSTSSVTSQVMNSPSRFKFESKVYDIQPGQHAGTFGAEFSSTPKSKASSNLNTTSPSKRHVAKNSKSHKKSNSLLNSLSQRLRAGSFSSTKSNEPVTRDEDEDEEYVEGDSTLTPLNLGEPGPALDLTTMTPKYNDDDYDTHPQTFTLETAKHNASPKKSKKSSLFHWRSKK